MTLLKNIFESYGNNPVFLEKDDFSWEEAEIVCEEMIEKPSFMVISSQNGLSPLYQILDLKGYHIGKDFNERTLTLSDDQPNLYGCMFNIGRRRS